MLSFVKFVFELLTLIFVRVFDLVEIDVLAGLKAFDLASKNFFDSWKTEEKEGVGDLSYVQEGEGKDER